MPLNVNTAEAMRAITVNGRCNHPEEILRGIEEAIAKAKKFFLYDSSGSFSTNHVWFKTKAQTPDGGLIDALIIPPPLKWTDSRRSA